MVEFCPDCGKPLQHRKVIDEFREGVGFFVFCSCGYSNTISTPLSHNQVIPAKEELGKGVLDPKDLLSTDDEGFPHNCSKCGHGWSDVHDLGIQYSDESSIHVFRCRKCGHTERHAEGSGN